MHGTSFYGSGGFYSNSQVDQVVYKTVGPSTVVNFNDAKENSKIKSLIVNVDPKLNLNGYDSAWAPGCGKNLYDVSAYPLTNEKWINGLSGEISTEDGSDYACTESFIPFEKFEGWTVTLNKRPGGENQGIAFYSSNNEESFISGIINDSGTAGEDITFTIPEGTKYIRFTVPVNAENVQIENGSSSTFWVPYANVCNDFVFWRGTYVYHYDEYPVILENLFDSSTITNGVYLKETGEIINSSSWCISDYISVENKNIASYTLKAAAANPRHVYYDENFNVVGAVSISVLQQTIPNNAKWVRCSLRKKDISSFEFTANKGYQILWIKQVQKDGSNIGGILDVTSGVLIVNKIRAYLYTSLMNNEQDIPGWKLDYTLEDRFEYNGNGNGIMGVRTNIGNNLSYNNQDKIIYLNPIYYNNMKQSDWIALNLQIRIQLPVKPKRYQLTPVEIKTFVGENYIEAESGNVTVTYRAEED